jgi:TonB-linked SusC/RagA family outer membrane protein
MKKIASLLVCFVLYGISILAQDIQVAGKIISADDASVLPGVSVVVKGTSFGTTSDINGEYTLSVPANAVLVYSFVGLKAQEVVVGSQTTINLSMQATITGIEEVVVTAFGIAKQKKALVYSSESVSDKEMTQVAQPNITNALQGKVAGLTVRQSSGMPGSSSYLLIRGAASINGDNQPLFVVDGMPIETGSFFTESSSTSRVSNTDASSRILDVNPEDIESIEVLKGPNAAALYGLRATNGVVLITTKSGKDIKNGESKINFSTSYTVDAVTRTPDLQSVYAQGNNGDFIQTSSSSWGPKISEIGSYYNITKQDSVKAATYDNVSPFFEKGSTYTADLSFAKASEFGNYNISFGYLDQNGIIPTTGMTRYSGKINADANLSDKLIVGATALYTNLTVDKIASGGNYSNPLFALYYTPRSYDLWGTPYAEEEDPYQQINFRNSTDNPLWSLENNQFNEVNDRIITNARIDYTPLTYLKVKYQLGVDYISNQQKEVYELGSEATSGFTDPPSGGKITDFSYVQREVNSNLLFVFDKNINDFTVNAILGSEFYQQYSRELKTIGSNFDLGGYHNIANTSSQESDEYITNRRTVGFFASAQADYKSIIYLMATARRDYVSYLAEGNRNYDYPSIGASFIFTELFEDPTGILSFGKLRASWAEVGQTLSYTYGTQNTYIEGGAASGFLSNGIDVPLDGVNAFSNSNILKSETLEPEKSKTIELGIDLRFLNGILGVDYTFYTTNFEDQIFQVPIAPSTGYTAELRNAGVMKSIGHEVILTVNPIRTTNFSWGIHINFSKYENTVEELYEGVSNIYLGGYTTPSIRAVEGETYPSIYGIGYLRDDAGNIVMLDNPESPYHGMPLTDPNAKKIGDVQPDFFVGFTNVIAYKGIVLSAQIDWNQGGSMYSGNNTLGQDYGMLAITEDRETKVVLDGVKGYVDNTTGELVVSGENDISIVRGEDYWSGVMYNVNEAHVYETSFVRFRELSIGYNLPASLLKNTFLKGVTVSIVGRNLALWTSYPNFDPETSTTGAVNAQGLEYIALPQSKSFGGKLSVTF